MKHLRHQCGVNYIYAFFSQFYFQQYYSDVHAVQCKSIHIVNKIIIHNYYTPNETAKVYAEQIWFTRSNNTLKSIFQAVSEFPHRVIAR